MRIISLKIPDVIFQALDGCAKSKNQSVEDVAVDILSDYVYPREECAKFSSDKPITIQIPNKSLVATHFSSAPYQSKKWAQEFVDTALSYSEVCAFPKETGIGFNPNFVFIERVYTEEMGFIASFECPPDIFKPYGYDLKDGWRPNWSRQSVKSINDLEVALKCIHITANAKGLERKE